MAVTKLSLYNDALLLVGQRKLSSDTEDVPVRYSLDQAYDDPPAASYCLELTKPKFSLLTAKLASPSAPTNHGFGNEYNFPSDYISLHSVFAEEELEQPIHRYLIEKQTIACEVATNIWLRYVSNAQVLTVWTPTFANVVVAYLAKSIAPRWAPQKLMPLEELFVQRVEVAVKLEGIKEETPRPAKSTATLSNTWRKVYNKAFFSLGLNQIISNTDDSDRRAKADVCVGLGLVETVLEDVGWTFAITSQEMNYDPSLEPDWGYNRVFAKPSDMHRLDGVFSDSFFRTPLKDYTDEGDNWFCGIDVIYVQYVKTSFLTNPDSWPQYFLNVVAEYMAVEIGTILEGDMENARLRLEACKREARSTDAMRGPPQMIKQGRWAGSRLTNRSYSGRP